MSAIVAEAVSKTYRSGVRALREVSLSVERGEIFGLLGPNGAGKTTLVKVLLDIVRPSRGRTALLGTSSRQTASRQRVGYLPEDHRFPDYHTAESALLFYAGLSGLSPRAARPRAAALLAEVGLADSTHSKVRGFSKGMKQRLGLAQALIADPEVLFLDEPTDGIDPVGRAHVRTLLEAERAKGRTIFLNSHLLSEVEQLCDRVGILRDGELVRVGTIEQLTQSERTLQVTLSQPAGDALLGELSRAFGPATAAGERGVEIALERDEQIDAVIDFLRARGLGVRGLAQKRQSLEAVFLASLREGER
ncbi:MAG: ABC transporter ATP-binding protein [Planctomycetes bacterium]|nr:ABC transporter ATP-binding protein [Planctomycetota bacterium]